MLNRLPEIFLTHGKKTDISANPDVQDFQETVKHAQSALKVVNSNNEEITFLREKFLQTTSSEKEVEIHSSLQEIVSHNNQQLNLVGRILESISNISKDSSVFSQDVENRMRSTMHATLARQFQEAIGNYEKSQEEYNKAVKSKTTSQLRAINPNITDEMIEQCILTPFKTQEIIESELIGAHSLLVDRVNEIEDRLRDIKLIEININTLHRMFLDLAALVHSQGQLINSIKNHVHGTSVTLEKSVKNLKNAKENQKKSRCSRCCLLGIGCIVLIVVLIPTVIFIAVSSV